MEGYGRSPESERERSDGQTFYSLLLKRILRQEFAGKMFFVFTVWTISHDSWAVSLKKKDQTGGTTGFIV